MPSAQANSSVSVSGTGIIGTGSSTATTSVRANTTVSASGTGITRAPIGTGSSAANVNSTSTNCTRTANLTRHHGYTYTNGKPIATGASANLTSSMIGTNPTPASTSSSLRTNVTSAKSVGTNPVPASTSSGSKINATTTSAVLLGTGSTLSKVFGSSYDCSNITGIEPYKTGGMKGTAGSPSITSLSIAAAVTTTSQSSSAAGSSNTSQGSANSVSGSSSAAGAGPIVSSSAASVTGSQGSSSVTSSGPGSLAAGTGSSSSPAVGTAGASPSTGSDPQGSGFGRPFRPVVKMVER